MSKLRAIRACGYIGMVSSVFLAVATGWAYSNYISALGTISQSLHETTQAAATVQDQIVIMTKARADVPESTVQVLRSSRTLVQNLQAVAAKQVKLMPKHAASIKAVADRTYEFSGTAIVAGDVLAVEIPTGIQMKGFMPTLVMGSPLYGASQKLKEIGLEGVGLGLSLEALAASLNGEALTIAASFADSCTQTLKLIDSLEKTVTSVKDEHLPQAIIAMESAKGTLRKVNDQAKFVNQLGYALLIIGILLAVVGGALSFATLRIATLFEDVDN